MTGEDADPRISVTVPVPPAEAFRIYTGRPTEWARSSTPSSGIRSPSPWSHGRRSRSASLEVGGMRRSQAKRSTSS